MESGVYLAIDSDSQNLFLHRFGMKFDFLQIYFFLIRHKEIKKNKNMPHESCVAEKCARIQHCSLKVLMAYFLKDKG